MTYYVAASADESGYLVHIGNKNSGRYPRGSGERPYQHSGGASVRATKGKLPQKGKSGMFDQTIKGGKDKPNISPAEQMIKQLGKIAESSSDIVKASERIQKGKGNSDSPAKKMSDEELRKAINRMELERRYDSLSANDTYDGFQKATDILSIVGGVVGIAGGLATIYAVTH